MIETRPPRLYPECANCPVVQEKVMSVGYPPEIEGMRLVHSQIKLTCKVESTSGVTGVFMSGEVTRTYDESGARGRMNITLQREAVLCPVNTHPVMKERTTKGVPYRNHQPRYRNS